MKLEAVECSREKHLMNACILRELLNSIIIYSTRIEHKSAKVIIMLRKSECKTQHNTFNLIGKSFITMKLNIMFLIEIVIQSVAIAQLNDISFIFEASKIPELQSTSNSEKYTNNILQLLIPFMNASVKVFNECRHRNSMFTRNSSR